MDAAAAVARFPSVLQCLPAAVVASPPHFLVKSTPFAASVPSDPPRVGESPHFALFKPVVCLFVYSEPSLPSFWLFFPVVMSLVGLNSPVFFLWPLVSISLF